MKQKETLNNTHNTTTPVPASGGRSIDTTTTSAEDEFSQAMNESLTLSSSHENNHPKNTRHDQQPPSKPHVTKSADGGTILQPIYIPTASGNDTWELTWPIWHLLPLRERREIAHQNGFRTIGDFEEEVILSRALTEKSSESVTGTGAGNHASGGTMINTNKSTSERTSSLGNATGNHSPSLVESKNDNESSSDQDDDEQEDHGSVVSSYEGDQLVDCTEHNQEDKNVETGGLILLLPDELILHHILPYLSTEYFAVCALVSPHWKGFSRSELAYKEICKRSYLNQSKRKALHVARFGGSYRAMLERRFRVKTGCGVYILKCTKIKKIQRDMWTEIPIGAILESTYYRYLNFYEDGRVLYSLTSKPPHEMIPTFIRIKAGHPVQASTVFGHYEIHKDVVTVKIQHPWHHVKLVLRILEHGAPGAEGRFWALEFVKHQSSASNNFDEYWSRDLVEYEVPTHPFVFVRNWKL